MGCPRQRDISLSCSDKGALFIPERWEVRCCSMEGETLWWFLVIQNWMFSECLLVIEPIKKGKITYRASWATGSPIEVARQTQVLPPLLMWNSVMYPKDQMPTNTVSYPLALSVSWRVGSIVRLTCCSSTETQLPLWSSLPLLQMRLLGVWYTPLLSSEQRNKHDSLQQCIAWEGLCVFQSRLIHIATLGA